VGRFAWGSGQACHGMGSGEKKGSQTGEDGAKLCILTGVTYGSSFVGMVNFHNIESSSSTQKTTKKGMNISQNVQAKAEALKWYASFCGTFGLDSSSAEEIKSLMSENEISSHVTLMTQGIIPSIKSNDVMTSVKKFADFGSAEGIEKLAKLASKNSAAPEDLDGQGEEARKDGQMGGIKRTTIEAVLSATASTDKVSNKVLDMNSMMTALDDYVQNTREAKGGVPVNFFVTTLRKTDVVAYWLREHRKFMYRAAMAGFYELEQEEQQKQE